MFILFILYLIGMHIYVIIKNDNNIILSVVLMAYALNCPLELINIILIHGCVMDTYNVIHFNVGTYRFYNLYECILCSTIIQFRSGCIFLRKFGFVLLFFFFLMSIYFVDLNLKITHIIIHKCVYIIIWGLGTE